MATTSMTNERKTLKKGRSKFTVVGTPKISKYTYNLDRTYDSGWTENSMSLNMDCGNGNVVAVDLKGGYFPNKESLIRVHGFTKDGETGKIKEDYDNKFTIDWDDRFDEDILETVAESCFIKVAIETDKNNELYVQKFLSAYDAVLYIQEHLTEDMVLDIRGNLKYKTFSIPICNGLGKVIYESIFKVQDINEILFFIYLFGRPKDFQDLINFKPYTKVVNNNKCVVNYEK